MKGGSEGKRGDRLKNGGGVRGKGKRRKRKEERG